MFLEKMHFSPSTVKVQYRTSILTCPHVNFNVFQQRICVTVLCSIRILGFWLLLEKTRILNLSWKNWTEIYKSALNYESDSETHQRAGRSSLRNARFLPTDLCISIFPQLSPTISFCIFKMHSVFAVWDAFYSIQGKEIFRKCCWNVAPNVISLFFEDGRQ